MIGEEAQRSTAEPGTPERLDGADDPVSSKDAKAAADALARDEFEAAWAALGPEASAAIADEVARVSAQARENDPDSHEASRGSNEAARGSDEAARGSSDAVPDPGSHEAAHERTSPQSIDDDERTPSRPREVSPRPVREPGAPRARAPRVKSSPPPPPPKPKPSAPPPLATKSPPPPPLPVEKDGEPDLLALSEAHARMAALAEPPPEPVMPQVIRVVEAPRSTERKLLVALVVLLVAVNGYFLVMQQWRTPEPVVDARAPVIQDARAPMDVREAAVAPPPTPAPIAAPTPTEPPPAIAAPAPIDPPAPTAAPAPIDPPAPPAIAPPVTTPAPIEEPQIVEPPRTTSRPKKPKPRSLPDKPEPRGTLPDKPEPRGTLPDKPEPGARPPADPAPAEAPKKPELLDL